MSLIPAAILPLLSLIVANLPLVSLTPVVHLDLRISLRILEKIRNDPNVIFRGLGEGDSWKKSRDTVPLRTILPTLPNYQKKEFLQLQLNGCLWDSMNLYDLNIVDSRSKNSHNQKLWNPWMLKLKEFTKGMCLSSQKNWLKMCHYVFSLSYSVIISTDESVCGRVKATIIVHMLPVLRDRHWF